MKILKYKIILLSLISLTLASCGSTTDEPLAPTNHHISVAEAAAKAIAAAKKIVK
ncbi:hypothetical protein CKC_04570 [Candidatus Liberibacter solanacearum CLso-ZC1]|uniref:Lipoprotein n=1 Tax=Liberibacter solanacearum (strain CLso-ZC1) TaxID=658172 RepID=E4UDI5_LIBSC|nr:hypothetical protein [Candidatus Liberibacter solanacearum]ADR52663.1 hypothetical protein CKC_04570 [Candidatus Liberibacter solanacearum CLso-ZC1]